ncbi:hypothetical protein TRIATDRAFT_319773 [Trichoderma atroviride IMI 206040]|uniref:C2H2-type domain-containing protein n=1 Tax=Hypocrea atroviridis (strain ATCC 20476 / IMI 206040) TaxID=452589 RepID=G9NYR3_HYPAI|nr:uncharacterized protein TRIATDRAFT_319773 [Trichoderma atroviride IMI 206040]EHK44519.1 hypothetical protein TRIATDRAFT_319773 [Trichoderma atroviride IMI 206040]
MEEASRQDDTSSYGDDDVASSDQGHVLSLESEDDLEFEADDYDKIYNRHVSHLVVECVGLFTRQMSQKNSPSASDKPDTTVKSQKEIADFIIHMNDTFRCWMAETADLADSIIHGLDSLFNEYRDVKVMLIGTLEVLIEDLKYVSSGETERLYTGYGVLEGIQVGIKQLYSLTNMIREASRQNDDLNFDMLLPFDKTADVKDRMFSIIRQMFPHARRSLCDQLALSVAIRRRRLRRTFKDADRLKARIARRAWSQANTNQAYPGRIFPPQLSETLPFYTLAPLPHNIKGSTASTELVDTSKMLNVGIAYSGRTTPSFLSRHPKAWELHVNRDVKPFVCLSEQCRSPVLFFASMERWIEHMNKMHSYEWTRRIHPASWICDTDHDAIQFKDVESFREHMNDKDSHLITPDGHELGVLEIEQWRYLPHDEYLCPLCDFTLDMPKRTISTDVAEDDPYRPLHEHIAGHLKDLAVLSLPILDTTEGPENLPDNYKAEGKRNWLKEGKKESCPRRYDQEVCDTFVSDVQRNSRVSHEHGLLTRSKSEPKHLAYPTRNSFDEEFTVYPMKNSFEEEFGTYFNTLQVYTAYGT